MKKSLSVLAAAATATVVLLSVPSSAKAQPAFRGTFRGPHGAFSIGVGPFVPQIGAYVPSPYYDEVYLDPDYGYGFYYDSQWIPCTRYGSRWIIAERPVVYRRPAIYGRDYAYGHGYVRPYRDYGRTFVQRDFGRRDFGRRGFGRRDFDGRRNWDGWRDGNRRGDRDNRHGWNRR
jgi:hypothetical protein